MPLCLFFPFPTMTDSTKSGKVRRSLSLSRKKAAVSAPITSLFSSGPPKLTCPLCQERIPRLKINEHIDTQCPNFHRRNGSVSVRDDDDDDEQSPTGRKIKETETSSDFKQQQTRDGTTVITGTDDNVIVTGIDDNVIVTGIDDKVCHKGNIQDFRDSDLQPAATNRIDLCCDQNHCETVKSDFNSSKLSKRKRSTASGTSTGSAKNAKHESINKAVKTELLTTAEINPEELSTLESNPPWSCDLPVESNPPWSCDPAWVPYYLQNFRTVLETVLENEDDAALFNQEDLSYVHAFNKLSVSGQKLYVRLFQRKLKWLQLSKVSYEEINNDLVPTAQELIQAGFLHNESDLEDLEEALDLLLAPDLKALSKTFHLSSSGSHKQQLIDGLLRLSKQKCMFSLSSAQSNIGAVILRRVKQMAGSCVRLCRSPRSVFCRLLLLFSLTDPEEEEENAAGGQNQLYTILLVNSGRLAFPCYTVQRETKLFQDREDLIRYEGAMRALLDVTLAMQGGQWEKALELYSAARGAWQELQKSHNLSYQEKLPLFLHRFTTGWAYTRILSRGVEILQRLRRYQEAVEELQSLLLQSVYCGQSRGRWWDRLALNLHQHLKNPQKAIYAIRDGLLDPQVHTGHKLSLHLRATRMKVSPTYKKYHRQLEQLPTIQFQDVKHVTIQGQLFPHEGGMGKSRFILPATEDGEENERATVICSVEDLCLSHYRQQGFDQGIHGEGSTFSTLFALLLWDIIFMDGIPDVFRNPYQPCPLDLHTDSFYENRMEAIECRVELLSNSSVETLKDMLEDVWNAQHGKVCSLIDWERFSSLHQAQTLVACMGGAFLSGVIARMAKNYRHCRGGLPDLVVWSTLNNSYKLVEVKGPNDRLSQKQQIWLDELQKLGADVEVCHVEATGAKRSRLE